LNLSDAQKEQIKTIWQVERPTVARLVREIAAEVGEMDAATALGKSDEGKVRGDCCAPGSKHRETVDREGAVENRKSTRQS
jgi:hypothetical protein